MAGALHVGESDQRNILRHAQPAVEGRAERADGQGIVRYEYGFDLLRVQQVHHAVIAVFFSKSALRDKGHQTGLRHHMPVSRRTVLRGRITDVSGQVRDAPIAQVNQMLGGLTAPPKSSA